MMRRFQSHFARELQAAAIAICILIIGDLCAMLWVAHTGLDRNIHRADVIVVFGTTVNTDGTPSRLLRWRLDEAYRLWEEGLSETIIVSGSTGKEGYDEADVMGDYLEDLGVPEEKIIRDSMGATSFATVRFAVDYMQAQHLQSAMVVSDYAHILRVRQTFRRFGIQSVYHSYSDIPMLSDVTYLNQEVIKLISYQFYQYEVD